MRVYIIVPLPSDYLKKKSGPQNGWALVSESVYYCPALPGLPEEEEWTPERLGPGHRLVVEAAKSKGEHGLGGGHYALVGHEHVTKQQERRAREREEVEEEGDGEHLEVLGRQLDLNVWGRQLG